MLYRIRRSAVLVPLTLLLGLCLPAVAAAQSSGRSIRFDELDAYARAGSPRAQILIENLAGVQAERDDALQWSNPEIAYEREQLEPYSEWQLTLSKSFVTPFSHNAKREGWADYVRASELRFGQDWSDLLAILKTGYVRLQLLDAYLAQLTELDSIVIKARDTAEARHGEGEMSGIDKRLIQLAALGLDATRRDALQEREETAARWQAEIGIPPGEEARLATPIAFKTVDLSPAEVYVNMLEERPAVQSLTTLQRALGKQAEAAKPSLVPQIDLYAGYKHVEPVADGWVAGAALSLPLFDRKAGAARRLEADRRIAESELELYRTRSSAEIASLVRLIQDAQAALASVSLPPDDGASVIGTMHSAYREGRYTLEAFLNAIQVQVTGSRGYYDQLYTYYENIFRLEAYTGTEIVSFSHEEGDEQ